MEVFVQQRHTQYLRGVLSWREGNHFKNNKLKVYQYFYGVGRDHTALHHEGHWLGLPGKWQDDLALTIKDHLAGSLAYNLPEGPGTALNFQIMESLEEELRAHILTYMNRSVVENTEFFSNTRRVPHLWLQDDLALAQFTTQQYCTTTQDFLDCTKLNIVCTLSENGGEQLIFISRCFIINDDITHIKCDVQFIEIT